MTASEKPAALAIAALAAATIAICLSAYTVKSIGENNRIYAGRSSTLHELLSLRERDANSRGGLRLFESSTLEPVDLESSAKKVIPQVNAKVEELADQALFNGWTLKSDSITMVDIEPERAGRLIEFLENQLPPWRLTSFEYTAATTERGEAKMTLQTISRARH